MVDDCVFVFVIVYVVLIYCNGVISYLYVSWVVLGMLFWISVEVVGFEGCLCYDSVEDNVLCIDVVVFEGDIDYLLLMFLEESFYYVEIVDFVVVFCDGWEVRVSLVDGIEVVVVVEVVYVLIVGGVLVDLLMIVLYFFVDVEEVV